MSDGLWTAVVLVLFTVVIVSGLFAGGDVLAEEREDIIVQSANALIEIDKRGCSAPADTNLRIQVNGTPEEDTITLSVNAPTTHSGLHIYPEASQQNIYSHSQNFTKSALGVYLENGMSEGEVTIADEGGVAGGENWSISGPPLTRAVWVEDGQIQCSPVFREQSSTPITTATDNRTLTTRYGRGFILLAPTEPTITNYTLPDGTTLQVVEHDRTNTSAKDVSEQLSQANGNFPIACQRNLTLYVVPGEHHDGNSGRALSHPVDYPGSAWVATGEPVEKIFEGSVWIHEYVHSRQCFRAEDDMEWIFEGSATYYSKTISDKTEFNRSNPAFFGDGPHHRTLTEFNESTRLDYTRGSRVLLHLDYEIQTQSSKSLVDVMRWMNSQSDPISYTEFRAKIVSLTSPETGQWLDSHVDGNASLSVNRTEYLYIIEGGEPHRNITPSNPTMDTNSSKRPNLEDVRPNRLD